MVCSRQLLFINIIKTQTTPANAAVTVRARRMRFSQSLVSPVGTGTKAGTASRLCKYRSAVGWNRFEKETERRPQIQVTASEDTIVILLV